MFSIKITASEISLNAELNESPSFYVYRIGTPHRTHTVINHPPTSFL